MTRRASLPSRLDRLAGQRGTADRERLIHQVAAETGLHPAEVRAEWDHIVARTRRFGPETPEQFIKRCAAELGLPEEELWAEYARITGTVGVPR